MSHSADPFGFIIVIILTVWSAFFALGFFTRVVTWMITDVLVAVGVFLLFRKRPPTSYAVIGVLLLWGVSWFGMKSRRWIFGDV